MTWQNPQLEEIFSTVEGATVSRESYSYLICLGNPEPDYAGTRHNAGVEFGNYFVESIAKMTQQEVQIKRDRKYIILRFPQTKIAVIKPQTYMNESALGVKAALDYFKDDLVHKKTAIAFDDLDIDLGITKVQLATWPHSHNGLDSIFREFTELKQTALAIRIGITTPEKDLIPKHRRSEFVLGRFSEAETELLKDSFSKYCLSQP